MIDVHTWQYQISVWASLACIKVVNAMCKILRGIWGIPCWLSTLALANC